MLLQIQDLQRSAFDLRKLAREAELPGYSEKLNRAAEQIERRAAELEGQTGGGILSAA